MSAGRFDFTYQYAAQKGGVFLVRIECVDASDAPVAITGTVEFTLWRTKNAGAALLEKELTVAANAAEFTITEEELDDIAVGEYAYRIRQISSVATLLIGGIFAVLPPGTGAVHLNSNPVRLVIGSTVVRVVLAGVIGGGGSERFVWTQADPDATWTITHNLSDFSHVTFLDADGYAFAAPWQRISNTQIIAGPFVPAQSGTAHIS